ncbi:MAG: CDP-alcohol phosphatidyltransferase family protein [Sphingobacteriales bacterium]|nr:CDP-alcohol phosphatidyltransferase family protein [Sphingobacteriales bacterium]
MTSVHHTRAFYVINGITLYRIVTVPLLLWLLFTSRYELFKWGIALSFFTDLIDGFLARTFNVTSIAGTKLDSIGDDLTVAVAVTGLVMIHPAFVKEQLWIWILLALLFVLQVGYALIRYRKMSNFHTWLAKTAALLQGIFLILTFFIGEPLPVLFYIAAGITMLELTEEIVLVYLLPGWRANVHGIFQVWQEQKQKRAPGDARPAE